MDFLTGEELLARCEDSGLPISGVMKRRETDNTEQSEEIVDARLKKALEIMKNSAHGPLLHPQKSMGGLIGGEAKRLGGACGERRMRSGYAARKGDPLQYGSVGGQCFDGDDRSRADGRLFGGRSGGVVCAAGRTGAV